MEVDGWGSVRGQITGLLKISVAVMRHPYPSGARRICVSVTSKALATDTAKYTPPTVPL